ncbi:MAG: MotA/TolQ/ExbB proton channel family protein [Chthoniobacteraceae bacterium]|jgi:biopolymer transport protein ExbB
MKVKLLIIAAALSLGAAALHAQEAASSAAPPAIHQKTLFQQIADGGWVMFPIAFCSIFTVYLIGDGILRTSSKKAAPAEYEAQVKQLFRQGDYVGAYNFCRDNPSPLTNVLRTGISLLGDGKQIAEEGMLGELAKENGKIQTWISYLSVIGVCAPMIGLLGTVTGMIRAFATLGSSGIGDPSSLSSAIGEVLTATASGLMIAIPAFGAFYFLRNRAAGAMHRIQDTINSLFRKMPYESLADVHIGDEELYAALPNWVQQSESAILSEESPVQS